MWRVPLALIAALVCAFPVAAGEMRYANPRFGTSVTFPAEIFSRASPPPANGDGMTWHSADGASLAVFGAYNVLSQSPRDLIAEAAGPGITITYSRTGKEWAVVSGTEGADIFYRRSEFGEDDVIHSLVLRYPARLKAKYDPLVGPIAASLDGP